MQLRPYQAEISSRSVLLLKQYNIAYLALEVRVGKTITAFDAAQKYGAASVLFVTKLKAISSIEKDYKEFQPSFKLTTINFESLHSIELGAHDLVIIDESHSCGQYPIPAERTKLLKQICKDKPIIYLSGTPSPESYSQLYHQFWVSSFSPFAEYKSFYKWALDYVNKKVKYLYNRQINDYTDAKKDLIDAKCAHLFISYTQEEAGFEQPVKEEVLYVQMQKTTYGLADKLRRKRIHIGAGGEEILGDTEVKLMNKLHQIFSGTVLAEDGNAVCFDHTKAKFIRDHFKGKKIAVFYKYKAEEMMLRCYLPNVVTDPMVFNESEDATFISQIQSGREGINLSTADCIVAMNLDFSAVSYFQMRARMQSKERTKEALLFWIFSEGGIEGKIYEAVSNKKDFTLSYFRKLNGLSHYKPTNSAI
jgi:hypothetical protein